MVTTVTAHPENWEAWLPTHCLPVDTQLTIQVRNAQEAVGSNSRNSCKLHEGFIGGSRPVHSSHPVFSTQEPWGLTGSLTLAHLSSVITALPPTLASPLQSPEEFLFYMAGQKQTKKARNKGRMLRGGVISAEHCWTPPSPAAESRPRPCGEAHSACIFYFIHLLKTTGDSA